jgi:hypothetical protein
VSVECVPSNICSDVRCAVCGQGFLIFTECQVRTHLDELRRNVQHTLRQHHMDSQHPTGAFTIETASAGASQTALA